MQSNLTMLRAKRLTLGDSLGLVAPASPFEPKDFLFGCQWLKHRGYQTVFQNDIFSRKEYLAGSDLRRKKEFEKAIGGEASGILFARGGYGSMRLFLGGLKLKAPADPKLLMGLSDVTVLLNYVAANFGWVTVHGPMLAGRQFSSLSEKQRDHAFQLLEHPREQELTAGEEFQSIISGTTGGTLWGGNLSLVVASLGTPLQIPNPKNGILFLEDVEESPYRLDRMMTQLSLSGFLSNFRAILLGDFTDPKGEIYSKAQMKSLITPLLRKKIPVIYGIASSHVRMDVLLPIGGTVKITPKKITISSLVR